MSLPRYDLHVFGLNLSGVPAGERGELGLSQQEVARVLESMALRYPRVEVVVVRSRNHVEAFVAAPAGTEVVRAWVAQLRRFRPDLLHRRWRRLHYHVSGNRAEAHLYRVAAGEYAPASASVYAGLKAALALAARCGTLGETLDGLFVERLEHIHVRQAEIRPAGATPVEASQA